MIKLKYYYLAILTFTFTHLMNAAEPDWPKDGEYNMKVTEMATHEGLSMARFPSDILPDKAYSPAKKEDQVSLKVTFKKKTTVVVLESGKVSGELLETTSDTKSYRLTEGLFAGGYLLVKKTKKGIIGTFSVSGSGVAVVSSKRGTIVKSGKKAK